MVNMISQVWQRSREVVGIARRHKQQAFCNIIIVAIGSDTVAHFGRTIMPKTAMCTGCTRNSTSSMSFKLAVTILSF